MKIILAEADEAVYRMLEHALKSGSSELEIIAAPSGSSRLQLVKLHRPALVVADTILPGMDGLSAMRAVRQLPVEMQPELVVISGYYSGLLQREVCALRPLLFATWPCDVDWLAGEILHCCRTLLCRFAGRGDDTAQNLRHLLLELGINPRCKGFAYIQTSVAMLMSGARTDRSLTKVLYPAVAKQHGVTAANVERAIRSAVMAAWKRPGLLLQREIFPARPTNGAFLVQLAEYLVDMCKFSQYK